MYGLSANFIMKMIIGYVRLIDIVNLITMKFINTFAISCSNYCTLVFILIFQPIHFLQVCKKRYIYSSHSVLVEVVNAQVVNQVLSM